MIRALSCSPVFTLLLLASPCPVGAEPAVDVAIAPSRSAEFGSVQFAKCGVAKRIDCVVDGDTFWHRGTKIRIADINTPETSRPGCAYEAGLGARATLRLTQFLNAGPFSLGRPSVQGGRDVDRYGRQLRTVTRGGQSLGAVLVAEGLAESWTGRRRDWCTAS